MKKLTVLLGLWLTAMVCSAAPVKMVFTNFQQPNAWLQGYPYTASVNGVAGVAVMCDDWAHGGLPGQTWFANYNDLGTVSLTGNLSQLRFNQPSNALTLYQESGWLLLQTDVLPHSQWQDINLAVWYNFDNDPAIPMTTLSWQLLAQAQSEAQLGFPGTNFSRVGIYTPVNQYGTWPTGRLDPEAPQEFLTIVPEPTTLVLLGGGLLGAWIRKRLK